MSASQLRRSIFLFRRSLKARVEPDGSSSWVYSADAKKLIFGRSATEVFKIQSGVKIAIRPQDILLRAAPSSVSHVHRGPEKVQANHSARLLVGECQGLVRAVHLTNRGDAAKVRVITLHDPTSLNFRRERDPPGDIGLNAFNRNDQVVMDDVGDSTGVRVIGLSPRPSAIYMTKDRARALELLNLGELPENSLGMSGSVIVLTQHDLDLPPGASADVTSVSVHHRHSLESALNAAALHDDGGEDTGLGFSSSNPSVNFAFDWAKASLFAIEGEGSKAERLWSGRGLSLVRSGAFASSLDAQKRGLRKDGTVSYDSQSEARGERPGPMETALHLVNLCAYLIARADDRKLLKKWYPHVRRVGQGLEGLLAEGLARSSPEAPDGWRRHLGAGFPTGFTAEVNLVVLRALMDASAVAYLAGKGTDCAKFNELGTRLLSALNERLRDSETGALALNVDSRGVAHREIVVDQAVGLSYFSPDENLASSVVHRMLEKDFETGYGPRTVPTSNNLYYSPSYAEGQLGGFWTRAALSHSLLAYSSGYPGIGSAQLERISRLVHFDAERLGGVPGEIPYWMDTERKQLVGQGSDPVSAARLVEAVVFGEAGLSLSSRGPRFKVPEASQLRWLLLQGLELGKRGSLFVGRSPSRVFIVSTFPEELFDDAPRAGEGMATTISGLPESERLGQAGGLEGAIFWDSTHSLVCLGNSGTSPFSGSVAVPSKPRAFSAALFAKVEELQQDTGLWGPVDTLKLLSTVELRVDLRPSSWKVLRLSRK